MTHPDDATVVRVCAEKLEWFHIPAYTAINEPVQGMQLVCGTCKAVIRCRDSYHWNRHESCGPMGGECYGGAWKLFASVWSCGIRAQSFPPVELNSLDALRPVVAKLTEEEWLHLVKILDKSNLGRVMSIMHQQRQQTIRWTLELPPDQLSRAVAQAILACGKEPT